MHGPLEHLDGAKFETDGRTDGRTYACRRQTDSGSSHGEEPGGKKKKKDVDDYMSFGFVMFS